MRRRQAKLEAFWGELLRGESSSPPEGVYRTFQLRGGRGEGLIIWYTLFGIYTTYTKIGIINVRKV